MIKRANTLAGINVRKTTGFFSFEKQKKNYTTPSKRP